MKDANDISLIIDARVPVVVLETFEEKRALEMLTRVAIKQGRPLFCWSQTEGINRLGFGHQHINGDELCAPEDALKCIKHERDPGIYVLCDLHPFLRQSSRVVRLIKDIALQHSQVPHTLVLVSHALDIPPELSRLSACFKLSLPSEEQALAIIREEARDWSKRNNGSRVKTDNDTLQMLVKNLRGMTFEDTRRLARVAIHDDGAITDEDLEEISKAKFELMKMEGVLSFEYDTEKFSAVGGLYNLKQWLEQRREVFLKPGELDRPKGIMLLGVQGGGKSLAAKSVAGMWGTPLLRLDFAALYNKYIGETEKNLREALALADVMAPCVLWIDEIEKGLSGGDGDDGTSRRALGTLLTWMAERNSSVFVVATSNDISGLPPELIRKGRLDEIFFVDLPDQHVREEIFAIHLEKRGHQREHFDLRELAGASEGFSGAEIEQVVVSGIYTSAAQQQSLDTDQLLQQILKTSPLSVVMAEQLGALRQWAAGRTVTA